MDRGASDPAEIVGSTILRREQVRRARSVEIDASWLALIDAPLDRIKPRIESAFDLTLGEREGAGFLRYQSGGFYKPHRDRGQVAGWPDAARRLVTVVVFLNEGSGDTPEFTGGHLRIYPESGEPACISPRTGLLVAFRATLLHEVLPIRAGTRDTVIDWFYDP
jgi:predicted 2-oxoglutarate/Fe(II)-dependent dioxygenase YbiX